MKTLHHIVLGVTMLCASLEATDVANVSTSNQTKIKVVNFKSCVEKSKLGKQEQSAFDALKKQMETTLGEREKVLNEMAAKFEDPDYLDSLSPEAETEMKRKFRALNQEYTQVQNQYYQTLNQTNFRVVQKLTEAAAKATKTVAKETNLDLVLNDESCFFVSPALDISTQIVTEMDKVFDKESSENKGTEASKPDEAKK